MTIRRLVSLSCLALLSTPACSEPTPQQATPACQPATSKAPRRTARYSVAPTVAPRIAKRTLGPATLPPAGARDPFAGPSAERPPIVRQLSCSGDVALRKHAVDELELTGIVGRGGGRLAMLRVRSSGKSATVRRGQRLGSSCLRIKAIHADRIIVEVSRQVDTADRRAEHVIALRKLGA